MSWRSIGSVVCAVALAAACSSDDSDEPGATGVAGAGAGGAPEPSAGSGGSSPLPASGGEGGGTAGKPGGGQPGSPNAGGDAAGGGAAGAAGTATDPGGSSSGCGAGQYQAGDDCKACPSGPPPSGPILLDCGKYGAGERDGDGNLLLSFPALAVHAPPGGQVTIAWTDTAELAGEATVDWEYSLALAKFVFHLPVEARYAVEFTLPSWTFSDACGLSFSGSSFRVHVDGNSNWLCEPPP